MKRALVQVVSYAVVCAVVLSAALLGHFEYGAQGASLTGPHSLVVADEAAGAEHDGALCADCDPDLPDSRACDFVNLSSCSTGLCCYSLSSFEWKISKTAGWFRTVPNAGKDYERDRRETPPPRLG